MELEDAFEDFLDDLSNQNDGRWFTSSIAGIEHPNADGTNRLAIIRSFTRRRELKLVPEPGNPFHNKAVRVETMGGQQVGFLLRNLAEQVFDSMARGHVWKCFYKEYEPNEYGQLRAVIGLVTWKPALSSQAHH